MAALPPLRRKAAKSSGHRNFGGLLLALGGAASGWWRCWYKNWKFCTTLLRHGAGVLQTWPNFLRQVIKEALAEEELLRRPGVKGASRNSPLVVQQIVNATLHLIGSLAFPIDIYIFKLKQSLALPVLLRRREFDDGHERATGLAQLAFFFGYFHQLHL